MPNVVGQSYEAAKNALEAAGFFMRATGTSTFYTNSSRAQSQSVAGGETAAIGTVIDVQFSHRGGGRLRRTGVDRLFQRAGRSNAQNLERMKPHP